MDDVEENHRDFSSDNSSTGDRSDDDMDSDFCSSESDDEPDVSINDQSLYDGSPMTVSEFVLGVYAIKARHDLKNVCISDWLDLFSRAIKKPNNCVSSIYKLNKVFPNSKASVVKHFYCSKCYIPIDNPDTKCSDCADGTSDFFFGNSTSYSTAIDV